jgi:FkbM family methyltransferase
MRCQAMAVVNNLIYDIGLHKGEDTDYYLRKKYRVIAIEANADLCRECTERFLTAIDSDRLIIINKAISDSAGSATFFINDQSVWGTLDPVWVKRNEARGAKSRPVKVDSTTIAEIVSHHGMPFYMKIDIEGADILCLKGLHGLNDKPRYISLESSATSLKDTLEQLDVLDQLGYTKFKIVPQHSVQKQRCPTLADYRFPKDSSGGFGEESPGKWQSLDTVKRKYRAIHFESRLVGPNNGIFRKLIPKRIARILFPRGTGWHDTHATY